MLKAFSVRNFRCLEDIEIHKLARTNILVGDNNSGKTAVLEALFAHLSQANAKSFLTLKAFRRTAQVYDETYWQDFFTGLDDSREINISSVDSDGKQRMSKVTVGPATQITVPVSPSSSDALQSGPRSPAMPFSVRSLQVEYKRAGMEEPLRNEVTFDPNKRAFVQPRQENPDLRGYYVSAAGPPAPETVADQMSELFVRKQKFAAIEIARLMDERIQDVSVASPGGIREVFVDLGGPRLFPLTLMGSGVIRAIAIASAVPVNAGGVVLVDEVEDGVYYKRLGDLWKHVYETARRHDVQIVASTHSAECVSAAIQAITPDSQDSDPLHVYRLERGKRLPIPYEGESLAAALEFMAEVR